MRPRGSSEMYISLLWAAVVVHRHPMEVAEEVPDIYGNIPVLSRSAYSIQ